MSCPLHRVISGQREEKNDPIQLGKLHLVKVFKMSLLDCLPLECWSTLFRHIIDVVLRVCYKNKPGSHLINVILGICHKTKKGLLHIIIIIVLGVGHKTKKASTLLL